MATKSPKSANKKSRPDALQIGSRTFKINRVAGLKMPDGKEAWGETNLEDATISVEASLRGRRKLETLLHEAIHAVADQYEMDGLSEDMVGWLGYGLTEVLLDNPELIEMLRTEAVARKARQERKPKR